uniref:Uncharacterized protein n=1 Tax=Zea mays TaxID=4577 RepID=C4J062_MAIZE|nr:unknown [Zea mays]
MLALVAELPKKQGRAMAQQGAPSG